MSIVMVVVVLILIFVGGGGVGGAVVWNLIHSHYDEKCQTKMRQVDTALAANGAALETAMAENAKLKVAFASGQLTGDGKRIAAMTLAALDVVSANGIAAVAEAS